MNANMFLTRQQQQLGSNPGYFHLGAVNTAPSPTAPCFLSQAFAPLTQHQQPSMQERQEHTMAPQQGFFIASSGDAGDVKGSQATSYSLLTSSMWAVPESATPFASTYQSSTSERVGNGSSSHSTGVNCLYPLNSSSPTAVDACGSPLVYSFSVQPQPRQKQQDAVCSADTTPTSPYVILAPAAGNASNSSNAPLYYVVNTSSTTASVQQPLATFIQGPNPQSLPNNTMNRQEQLPTYLLSQSSANVMGIPWTAQFVPNSDTAPAGGFPLLMSNPPTNHADGNILLDSRSFQHKPQQYYRQKQQPPQQQQQQLQSHYMGATSNPSTPSAPSPSGMRRRVRCSDVPVVRDSSSKSGGGSGTGTQDCEARAGVPYSMDPVPIDFSKTQLIVNFLPQSLTDEDFRSLFARFGPLHRKPTKIIYDQSSRRRKGFGFVYYKDGHSTEAAIKEMNGYIVGGRKLKVRYADQQRSSIDCDSCNGDGVGTPQLDEAEDECVKSHDNLMWTKQEICHIDEN